MHRTPDLELTETPMFLGHYALAFAAKPVAPKTSLGTLIAAAAFLDLVWSVLVLAGIEVVRVDPAATAFTPLDFVSYPYSHSLAAALGWGVLFGGGYLFARRDSRAAIVLAILVVSHWFLDFVSHRPDLPLLPGATAKFGLGLWNDLPATLAVELAIFAAGVWLYARATATVDRIGRWSLFALAAFLLVIYAGAALGPPPPNAAAVAWSDTGQFLIIILAAWIDRRRTRAPGR